MDKPLTPDHIHTPNIDSLTASLSPRARHLLEHAVAEAARRRLELWAVGGMVRDAATGRPLVDVDLAVNRDVDALARGVASAAGGEVVSLEDRFGTATVTFDGERLDLATLRAEEYSAPGALPTVSLGAPIERDLERRDFSVNAIALGLSGSRRGELVDPYDGLADLTARRLQVLHDQSFQDDATRLWRAGRLSAHHGLRPSPETRELIVEGVRWLETISGDRLWNEFALVAERGRAGRALGLLDDWSVLKATSPALALADDARRVLRHRWRPLPAARLAAVLLAQRRPEAARTALVRLNAPPGAAQAVADARTLLAVTEAAAAAPGAATEPAQLEALAGTGEDGRAAARWLDPRQDGLQRALRRWERTQPHLNARELMRIGVAEGPELGSLLRCLRRGRYLGTLGTAAEARAFARDHLERREGAR